MNDIRITPVGIRDLTEITDYKISIRDGQTVHTAMFSNGGKLQLTVLGNGQVKVVTDKLDAYINTPSTIFFTHKSPKRTMRREKLRLVVILRIVPIALLVGLTANSGGRKLRKRYWSAPATEWTFPTVANFKPNNALHFILRSLSLTSEK